MNLNNQDLSDEYPLDMVINMDFFGEIIEKINSVGFAPFKPLEQSKKTYTLHNVIRDQIGMAELQNLTIKEDKNGKTLSEPRREVHITADLADVSYWDYKIYREFLTKIHKLVDEKVSMSEGRKTNAMAWEHDPKRTQSQILDLLKALQADNPEIIVPERAVKRPNAKTMIQRGAVESAIGNTLAVLAENGSNYSDLLETISDLNLQNEELLDDLDERVKRAKCNRTQIDKKSLLPRTLVESYERYRSKQFQISQRSPSICQFLKEIARNNNLSGNSESVLIERLTAAAK